MARRLSRGSLMNSTPVMLVSFRSSPGAKTPTFRQMASAVSLLSPVITITCKMLALLAVAPQRNPPHTPPCWLQYAKDCRQSSFACQLCLHALNADTAVHSTCHMQSRLSGRCQHAAPFATSPKSVNGPRVCTYPDACQLAVPDCIPNLRPGWIFQTRKAQQGQTCLYRLIVGRFCELAVSWMLRPVIVGQVT